MDSRERHTTVPTNKASMLARALRVRWSEVRAGLLRERHLRGLQVAAYARVVHQLLGQAAQRNDTPLGNGDVTRPRGIMQGKLGGQEGKVAVHASAQRVHHLCRPSMLSSATCPSKPCIPVLLVSGQVAAHLDAFTGFTYLLHPVDVGKLRAGHNFALDLAHCAGQRSCRLDRHKLHVRVFGLRHFNLGQATQPFFRFA